MKEERVTLFWVVLGKVHHHGYSDDHTFFYSVPVLGHNDVMAVGGLKQWIGEGHHQMVMGVGRTQE